VVPIRLDAEVEKPWLRDTKKFKHHPIEPWIAENRGNLVWGVLTLVNKWLSAGKPKPKKLKNQLGSYESYCTVIGGIFEAAGIVGFLDNLSDFYNESDHESDVLGSFVLDWWNEYGTQEVFVSDLLVMVEENGTPLPLGDGTAHSKKIRLGNFLNHNRNRHINNFKIIKGKKLQGATRWRLGHSTIKPVDSHAEDSKNRINST
jgi:putative DNA primase/helicase